MVEVQKLKVFCDFCGSRTTLCGDRRGRGAKTQGFLRFLRFLATLCGNRRDRGAKTRGFCDLCEPSAGIGDFCGARTTLCGNRRGRGAKTQGFLRFLRCSRDPLRESAWSRCKNSRFFAIATLCGNRRGRGAKTRGFLRFVRCSRNPLRESAWSRCKNSRFFATFFVRTGPRELSRGSRACSRDRRVSGSIPPGPRAGVARCNLHFKATCAEQLAQSKLHRATCADQLAPTSLRRAPCLEQLAQSNLRRATCTEQLAPEQLAGSAICTEQLAGSHLRGATCAEQLAQCNLRRATCADQLAPTSLRRAPCLVLSRACFTNASCREKERILQRWADLSCDVLLSGQPWSSLGFAPDSCYSLVLADESSAVVSK